MRNERRRDCNAPIRIRPHHSGVAHRASDPHRRRTLIWRKRMRLRFVECISGCFVNLAHFSHPQSFSRLWVEFLLTEANAGGDAAAPPRSPRPNNSLPGSPTHSVYGQSLSPTSAKGTRRLSSFNAAVVASSPNLTLDSPPSRKGKEKAVDS